ncbi:restriction endonuclease subunit S [Acinetobacter junii]|uniref:restriction endonuclease subunit S n=1 Tax=Acinetobacter junii TaxID=40215 RepID=UPI001C068263|nr:restriction endonuclease subunit S [Acinetobacter junii]
MEKQKCPELRFSQFKDEWYETTLGDVVDIVGGGTPDTNVPEFWNGDIDWYSPTEIGENVYANGSTKKITALGLKNSSAKILPAKKTVLFSSRAGIGDMAILDKPAATNQGFQSFVANNIDVYFLYSMGVKIKKFALSKASGSTFLEISRNQLAQMEFLAPSIDSNEQTQIGNFFQNLDQSLALHEKKLAQTQNLKKAMLEKMFPKAGDKQPEIRLKGFSGDWPGLRIFDLAQNGKLNNGVFNDQNKRGKGYKLINVLYMYIETSIDEKKLTLLDLDRKEFEQNKVKYGDVFFTRSSLVKEGIAFSNVYLGHSNDITYDGHLIKLSPNLELVDPIFLNYCLKSSKMRTQLILGGKSTTMTTIGQQEVGETIVGLPSMSEQLKIGQFFKRLDETLLLQQQKLQTLKNLKRAFLEKMFV